MTSSRDSLKLCSTELTAFLREPNVMNIATHNHDGTIHLVAMWYGLTEDGRIGFATYAKSQKVQNLNRDSRITGLVEDGTTYDTLRGAEFVGEGEVTQDPDALHVVIATNRAPSGQIASVRSEQWRAIGSRSS